MASKLCRCIQVWLMLLLCWFVLRSDPVTQGSEAELKSEDLAGEKGQLGFTELHATPSLVSIHHTETIIPEHLDQATLVTRPPIAPATPWDDTQVLSTVSEQKARQDSSEEREILAEESTLHTETQIPGNIQENPSSDDTKQDATEVGSSGNALGDGLARSDPAGIVNDVQSSTSESIVQTNVIDGPEKVEIVENNKLDVGNEDQGEMEKRFPEPEQFIMSEDEAKSTSGHNADELAPAQHPDNLQDGELGDSQKTEDQNDVREILDGNNEGTHDGLEGTQGDLDSTHDDLGGTREDLDSTHDGLGGTREDLDSTHDGLEGTQEDLDSAQDGLAGTQEDMPSFNEWSQKFLAQEEEKKVAQINEKGTPDIATQLKKKNIDRKQNNYASVDCGANIPEKNVEAQNAHSILLENKDLYMLNPCSADIWFVVELCDHVQVTSLQLANFEMFSSTIEKFQVSFSTRYPTRDWNQLQEFVAKPEKSIQTFTVDPIFAKYIKVEQLSHHGSEHYCPWSLLRVYGNSMVEEYEEHESSQDGNPSIDEDLNTSSNTTEDKQVNQGILKSATDAVLNFVKETAKKLVTTEDDTSPTSNTTNITKYPEDNSSQPLPPKTIVQLMPREDYEASCHGDNDETPTTCFSGNRCTSTDYAPHSYMTFLQIVHNICSARKNMKTADVCFTNFSKIFVTNGTNKDQNLSKNANEKNFSSAIKGAHDENLGTNGSEYLPEKGDSKQNVGGSDSAETEKLHEEDPESIVTSSQSVLTETNSASNSVVHIDTQPSSETPIISTVLPSSITGNSLGGSSVQVPTIRSSVASSVAECDFDCASAPTPLARPPLAVDDEARLAEPPTQKQVTSAKETVSQKSSNIPIPNQSSDSPRASEGLPNVNDSPTSASDNAAAISSSNTTEIQTSDSEKTSKMSQNGSPEASSGDTLVHEGSHGDNKKYEQGSHRGNKEYEDVSNPHVDVLKITLTDAETKEGTAEPEQANEDPVSDVETQLNETKVSSVNEGKESEKVDTDVGGTTEKDVNEVETRKEDSVDSQVENSALVEQGEDVGTDALDENQTETQLTGSSLVNADTNIVKEDSSDGQCEMKDVPKLSKGVGLSNNDPSSVEPGPIQGVGNGNGNTYGKKESIFVALSRKIKALEQNVTMTNLFLEELSQRYRKSMDEVQKKMEKKFSMFSKNSKLLTKVNLSQNSTIIALTSRIGHLEEKLKEATSRLKAVNQEVVERHVIGMCLQFLFVIITWFVLRRVGGRSQQPARQTHAGNGHLVNGTALCNGTEYQQLNGNFEDLEHEKHYLDECNASKLFTPEAISETKRRKRRKNRPNSVTSDQESSQNIVSRTAGLLFHIPGFQDKDRAATKGSGSLRSCSADSLSSLTHEERKLNSKKSAFSPKSKKVFFRNKNDADSGGTRSCASETRNTRERPQTPHTKLVRSKSSGECYENKLALSDVALSTSAPKITLGNARCSLQSTSESLKGQKSRWIWGLG